MRLESGCNLRGHGMEWRDLLCRLGVAAAMIGTASAEQLPITAYTTADGLAHERVRCIVADSRRFLWFCGREGLSRFDGQEFTTYGAAQGLAIQSINAILETSRGVYWVATNGAGVYRLNPVTLSLLTHGAGRRRRRPTRCRQLVPVHGIPLGR